jgi:hypothetical protein
MRPTDTEKIVNFILRLKDLVLMVRQNASKDLGIPLGSTILRWVHPEAFKHPDDQPDHSLVPDSMPQRFASMGRESFV